MYHDSIQRYEILRYLTLSKSLRSFDHTLGVPQTARQIESTTGLGIPITWIRAQLWQRSLVSVSLLVLLAPACKGVRRVHFGLRVPFDHCAGRHRWFDGNTALVKVTRKRIVERGFCSSDSRRCEIKLRSKTAKDTHRRLRVVAESGARRDPAHSAVPTDALARVLAWPQPRIRLPVRLDKLGTRGTGRAMPLALVPIVFAGVSLAGRGSKGVFRGPSPGATGGDLSE